VVAHHPDEPEERDARKRDKIQGKCDDVLVERIGEPGTEVTRFGYDLEPDNEQADRKQHREDDARNRGRARRPDGLAGFG